MKDLIVESAFLKDWKRLEKKNYNKQDLLDVVQMLRENLVQGKLRDHALSGNYRGYRECHVRSNWLLVYKSTETEIILVATGIHDDLFK